MVTYEKVGNAVIAHINNRQGIEVFTGSEAQCRDYIASKANEHGVNISGFGGHQKECVEVPESAEEALAEQKKNQGA